MIFPALYIVVKCSDRTFYTFMIHGDMKLCIFMVVRVYCPGNIDNSWYCTDQQTLQHIWIAWHPTRTFQIYWYRLIAGPSSLWLCCYQWFRTLITILQSTINNSCSDFSKRLIVTAGHLLLQKVDNSNIIVEQIFMTDKKIHINCQYQLSVHQSIWGPVHLKSPQTSKIMWQYISLRSHWWSSG